MNYIAWGRPSEGEPPQDHQEYVKLNFLINTIFYSVELFRQCLLMRGNCSEKVRQLLELHADPSSFVRADGSTARDAVAAAGEAPGERREVVRALLASSGSRNFARKVALEEVRDFHDSFLEKAPQLATELNDGLKLDIMAIQSRALFGGTGGGGIGRELLPAWKKQLQETAAKLKRFPTAPCRVRIQEFGEKQPEKLAWQRANAVGDFLTRECGCSNPLVFMSSRHPPCVSITIALPEKLVTEMSGAGVVAECVRTYASSHSPASKVRQVFKEWDTDGNGVISRQELASVFRALLPSFTEEDIDTVFAAADADRDGGISYEDFIRWLDNAPAEEMMRLVKDGD